MTIKKHLLLFLILILIISNGTHFAGDKWIMEEFTEYSLFYTKSDTANSAEYIKLINNGIITVRNFFSLDYHNKFDVYIHPNRESLDSTWQKDWNLPDFKSECWMVASGVANKADIISPKMWDMESCEHSFYDTVKTQQLITHELIHVYHGQINASPDFSNIDGIDWFAEGLATFASGQCDSIRLLEVKKAFNENKLPKSLDELWTGKLNYGLSGSIVMFIDKKFGREKLTELLQFNKKSEILDKLKISESELIANWIYYIQHL